MAERKRIALLVGQPEESYQKQFLEGFLENSFAYNYDVCIFAMYQKRQSSAARQIGESNIFSLIRYDMFDAVLILSGTLMTPGIAEQLEEKVKEIFNGPVICADAESKYFYSVLSDNYLPVKKIISHLIEEHGYHDIAYVTGDEWSIDSKQRLESFLDCMKEHALTVKDNRIFYGDFWYTGGEYAAKALLKDKEHLPEAVACANDIMAIGLSEVFEKNGIHVPQDVAVVGFDSVEEGFTSPKPITSVRRFPQNYGMYVADCIKAMMEGTKLPVYDAKAELFLGSSCGCHNESLNARIPVREGWATDDLEESYYSHMNLLMEDLMIQEDFHGLISTIYSYVYQIRPFDSFHLCLNDWWGNPEQMMIPEGGRHNFTKEMLHILQCGSDDSVQDKVDFEEYFDTGSLLPDMFLERETPKAYIFTPLHFEEQCFGYAILSYGNQPRSYNEVYRFWLRSVIQGLECYRRVQALKQSNRNMQIQALRDELTGFYNYNGLLEQAGNIVNRSLEENCFVTVLVVDINGLSAINDNFGREEGNRVIVTLARLLESCMEDGVTCSLGNGEFLLLEYTKEYSRKKIHSIRDRLLNLIEQQNIMEGNPYGIFVYTGSNTERVSNKKDFEQLINATVSRKNGNKIAEQKLISMKEFTKKDLEDAKLVRKILDENLLSYHFQPIVNAKNGEIYAYEALMRADIEPQISPMRILKFAEHFGRLYDVEKATFFNVLKYIEENEELFEERKVFINSIPGSNLEGEDQNAVRIQMNKRSGMMVVELTEQAEMNDEDLSIMKDEYEQNDVQTAVDDYGTGYSNITNLLRYMPNYVKIDRLLLNEIQDSPQKQHFVRDIVDFAHDNDIMALAEGVETSKELKTVVDLGIDLVQGFYTAKPAPVPIKEIAPEIKEEILRYNQAEENKKKSRIYIAGIERRVSLVNLVARKYASIHVENEEASHKDISIMSVPGFRANMDIKIADGFDGRIVLNHVSLSGKKNQPCIEIGENCDVTFVLEGDNELLTGGILVPESSKLTLQGNGNLFISGNNTGGYGIGNVADARHGIIFLEQDGTIDIRLEGSRVIGIGSGNGGEIQIRRGKYIIRLKGQECVAMGALQADSTMLAEEFDMECYITSDTGVCLGSLFGSTKLCLRNALARYSFSGKKAVGIGSIAGKQNKVSIKHANVSMDLRGDQICGIGGMDGTATCELSYTALTFRGEGEHVIALGCMDQTGKIRMENCDVNTAILSDHDEDFGAKEDAIEMIAGRNHFEHNGQVIQIS